MYTRLLQVPSKSFFLFGPRGTGKTTWVKAQFPGAVYVDLLEAELYNDLLANPQRLSRLIPADYAGWVVVDEIQRIPELLNEVHRLIETRRYRFVLTGSSARKLRRAGHNLLAGRALTCSFHPLTTVELGKDFRLQHSLQYGSLPCVYTEPNPNAYLESYVTTYLEEEIRQEGVTRRLDAFARFLEAASFSQGALLSVSSVAQECAVERKVAEHYFSILEDLLVAHRVPIFQRRAKRRLTAHPKFYFFDVGVYRTIRPRGPLDAPEEMEGAAFETLLFQELMAVNASLQLGYRLHYWRTANHAEVDFVLYGERGLVAFEVKRTARLMGDMLRGLRLFRHDYPMAKAYFVYGGTRRLTQEHITIVPMEELLCDLPAVLGASGAQAAHRGS